MKKFFFYSLFLVVSHWVSAQHRIGFRIAGNTSGQHFQMRVNTPPESNALGEPIFIDVNSSTVAYTAAIYPAGISIFFMQQEGPRQTYYNGGTYGVVTVGNGDLIVDLSLDPPAPEPQQNGRKLVLSINQPGTSEVFDFIIEKGRRRITNLTLTDSYYQNVATDKFFLSGDTLNISQTMGPRVCNLSSYYVVPASGDLSVNLNCGNPPPAKDRAILFSIAQPAPGELFEFIIQRGERRITSISLKSDNYQNVSTGKLFSGADTLRIYQTMGPRACNLAPPYIIPETGDLIVTPDCGTSPPPKDRAIILTINKPAAGELYDFIIEKGDRRITNLTLTASNYQNVATGKFFARGDTLRLTQTMGPKVCSTASIYVIPQTGDLKINLNCGAINPAAGPRVGVRINKPPLGKSFTYRLYKKGVQQELSTLTITAPNFIEYFPDPLHVGDTVFVFYVPQSQMWSSLGGRTYFVLQNKDTIIDVSMGFMAAMSINSIGFNDQFRFELRHSGQPKDTVEVSRSNASGAYFRKNRFYEGDTLYVRQLSGKRVCGLPPYTIMTNNNTYINANCGDAYTDTNIYRLGVRVRDMSPGEVYEFTAPDYGFSTGLFVREKDSVSFFGSSYHKGDTIFLTQDYGPKTVKFASNPVIFGNADIIMDGYVGVLPVKTKLSGTFAGAPGSRIVIRSGANEELTLTAGANGKVGFRFPKEYTEGANYSITIKTPPPNCNCAILPAATGTIPVDSTELSIICTQAIELVSRNTDDKATNTFYETASPVVGGKGADEGRYVAFVSSGAGLDGSLGKYRQIYWRDVKSGITKLISRSPDGSEGNNNSFAPSISSDGSSVAFESYATNLAGSDNNGVRDVYLWKKDAGIVCVTCSGNGESFEPVISGNGNRIVFSSGSSTLTAGVDGTSTINVFSSDGAGSFQLLSKDPKTGKGVGGSAPHISEDGNKIVFCSYSGNLVQDDKNNLWDIFLWQEGNPQLKKISLTASGGDRNQGEESASRVVQASISGNGNYIVYATTASNMVSGDNNKLQDIFICNIGGSGVRRLSVTANNTEGDGDSPIEQGGRIGISYDGKWICYQTNASNLGLAKGNIVLQNTQTGRIIPVTNSIYNTTGRPMISRYAASVVAGCSEKMDKRFTSSGIFEFFTGPQVSANQ